MKQLTFSTARYMNHPIVEYCSDVTTCGPLQMFWEYSIKKYNDPTTTQFGWYQIVKLVIVTFDWSIILSILAVPASIESIAWLSKFDGTLTQQKTEYAATQAQYLPAEE